MDVRQVARAAAIAAVVSGAPSTVWALATGEDPLGPTRAAGALLVPTPSRPARVLAAAALAHLALSAGWASVLALGLPRRHRVFWGAAAGAGIAGLDLGVAHYSGRSRFAAVAALPVLPQLADHVLFGAVVAATLDKGSHHRPTLERP